MQAPQPHHSPPFPPQSQQSSKRLKKIIQRSIPDPIPSTTQSSNNISGFQMFKASKKYQYILDLLSVVGIWLGAISGIAHVLGYFMPAVIGLFAIAVSVGIAEIYHYTKSLNFTQKQDPLLTHISSSKPLTLITNLFHFIHSIKPILNYLSSIILTVILIIGILTYFYHDIIINDQVLHQFTQNIE